MSGEPAFTEREARIGTYVAVGLRLLTATVLMSLVLWAHGPHTAI